MSGTLIEVVGYAGSAFLVLSLLQKSIFRLRAIGLAASLAFLVYSIFIGAYPIAVVNVVAGGIHLYFLRKLVVHKDEVFTILPVRPDSDYLAYFLDFHKAEIATRQQPDFVYEPDAQTFAAFLLRDMVPAGLFVANRHDDGALEVQLDYVIPQYRDFKMGPWLYSAESGLFAKAGCQCAWARADTEQQKEYFTKVGFFPDPIPGIPDRYAFRLVGDAAR